MTTPTSALLLPKAKDFLRFGPHNGAHRPAIRAAVAVVVPLAVLCLIGRPEWGPYAVFGSMLSVYGRGIARHARLRMQAETGLGLVLCVVLGVALAALGAAPVVNILATAMIAAVASAVADRRRWQPGGPIFFVFGFAVCAWMPATASTIGIAAICAGVSALFALAVGYVGLALPAARRQARAAKAAPQHPAAAGPSPAMIALHAGLCGVAAALAGLTSYALGLGFSYWAMVAAVVPVVGGSTAAQLLRAGHRVIGTMLGLVIAAGLLFLPLNLVGIVVVIGLLQIGAELTVARNYSAALLFITPLALMMMHLTRPLPVGEVLRDRAIDTIIGVLVTALLLLATHRLRKRLRAAAAAG
ncbi:FUSC family protein [Lysinibacter cavernae]|uniref:Integral membrane bound transporter domain-containing protein n=1 Tax=Lysinibacter cavernae TaxID=1640652 RepID=A0A7X5R2F5_9MICO|nr:FUSC family protein [Lysinibacter cavernae]NIH54448.1 hypothetical protein [Lysinibacter cavernae]